MLHEIKSYFSPINLYCDVPRRIKSLYNLFDNLANNVANIEFNGI